MFESFLVIDTLALIIEPCHEVTLSICKNKGADQLRGIRAADQHLYFRYIDRKSLFFLKQKIQASSYSHLLWLCWTWSETPKTGFLAMWLNIVFKNQRIKDNDVFYQAFLNSGEIGLAGGQKPAIEPVPREGINSPSQISLNCRRAKHLFFRFQLLNSPESEQAGFES